MFKSHLYADDNKRPVLDGIDITPLVWGEKTIMVKFNLMRGSAIPVHDHLYEQTGLLVSGLLRLTIADETFEAVAGDSWCIPAHVSHKAEALEDCVAVEIFSPLREDYLP